MSLKKIEQVKKDKGFKIFDLIIYGVILLTVAAVFIAVFTTRNSNPLSGVRIYVASAQVFEYEFGGQPLKIEGGGVTVEVVEEGAGMTVTVRTDGGYNVLYIDKSARTAKMRKADCHSQQCVYFPEMKDNSGFIYCDPHGLRVEPLIKDYDSPDIPI